MKTRNSTRQLDTSAIGIKNSIQMVNHNELHIRVEREFQDVFLSVQIIIRGPFKQQTLKEKQRGHNIR